VARDGVGLEALKDASTLEDLLRELAPQVLGPLVRRSGDFDAAEDAVQESLIAAADHWPREGIPPNPRGWLLRTASRRLIDEKRSGTARAEREVLAARLEAPTTDATDADDTLAVLVMCCHPSLTPASAIALTLRAVGGLTTAEIARAFLVPEATMAQRISRAKRTIGESDVPFGMPAADARPTAIRSVLHVLYLIFNEGYAASRGPDLHRADLSDEAIRLARLVQRELPDDAEAAGLLALMLLIDARRPARMNHDGDLIPLAEQDRSAWDRGRIAEGTATLNAAIARGGVGEYQLQAAIAAIHDRAPTADATDWPQILALYALLERMTGSPVVTLNRAVATAMVHGPEAGLAALDGLDERLGDHHRLAAVRAHLLERSGDVDRALEQYRIAAARTPSLPEQRHLAMRAARLNAARRDPKNSRQGG
jgi:predicted RNA polymerase sigma factor